MLGGAVVAVAVGEDCDDDGGELGDEAVGPLLGLVGLEGDAGVVGLEDVPPPPPEGGVVGDVVVPPPDDGTPPCSVTTIPPGLNTIRAVHSPLGAALVAVAVTVML